MKYRNGYAGVKKLFASEILNIIASLLFFAASVIIIAVSSSITEPEYLPAVIIPLICSGVIGICAFFLQIAGLQRARRDNPRFRTALIFVFVGIAAELVTVLTGGTFGNIFSGINEVAVLLVSVYTILGIYDLAEEREDSYVMLHGKIALFVGASVFAVVVLVRIIPVFVPRTEKLLDVICAGLELTGYFVFVIFLARAKTMLSGKKRGYKPAR